MRPDNQPESAMDAIFYSFIAVGFLCKLAVTIVAHRYPIRGERLVRVKELGKLTWRCVEKLQSWCSDH